jgi:tRNA A-37 threonylcarbamoyl transferase component Bud32
MKQASGLKMRKATHDEWKKWFEEKSSIPVIENQDPNTVVMPFLPNVNALDAFIHDKKIKNFGECEWAEHLTPEDKLQLAHGIMDEMRRLHGQGIVWGEAILPNMILTKHRQPVICDPEIRFDEGMPLKEAMARDLRDLCLSIGSALEMAEGMDVHNVIRNLLDRYGDREVVVELQNLAHKKDTLLQKLTKGYELVRSGAGTSKRYEAILGAIRDYNSDRLVQGYKKT